MIAYGVTISLSDGEFQSNQSLDVSVYVSVYVKQTKKKNISGDNIVLQSKENRQT